jgi:hypothetical protein
MMMIAMMMMMMMTFICSCRNNKQLGDPWSVVVRGFSFVSAFSPKDALSKTG